MSKAGKLSLEYSAFSVDGRPDLSLVVYNPATPADAERIRKLLQGETAKQEPKPSRKPSRR